MTSQEGTKKDAGFVECAVIDGWSFWEGERETERASVGFCMNRFRQFRIKPRPLG